MELSKEVRLSRRDLYERVWSRPIQEVARELGLSDVGLAKMCRRDGIPLPPRGYHLMAASPAKQRLVIKLPADQDNDRPTLSFRVPDATVLEARSRSSVELAELKARTPSQSAPELRRTIDARMTILRRAVDRRRTDDRGVIVTPSVDFAVRVSPAAFDRSISILAALSERLLSLGALFSTGDNWRKDSLCFRWEGYDFAFKLEETSSRQPIPAGKRVPRTYSRYRGDDWYFAPTGKLTLEGRGPGYELLALRDGKELIEERLDDLVLRMYEVIAGQREVDRIKAVRQERTIAYLQKKDEARQLEEFEVRRRRQLHAEARQHRQAESLRHYIQEVERHEARPGGPLSNQGERDKWVEWAKAYAATLDPIASGRAGTPPPYPEPREITEFPAIFLRFDTPEEAEEEMRLKPWGRY